MQLDPSAVVGQITESYMKLPLLQKILFPMLVIGSIAGIVLVSQWANQPTYSVLFSDLEPADSSAVIDILKEQKIDYQIRGDGKTIAVHPPELVHELRISLASDGLPNKGAVGFEIFETAELGTTTFQERMKFLRASQGELERTILSLEAVQAARVHITQPEKTVFARRGTEATASVLLKLRPGQELSKKQIKGIAHLVAGSVEGLTLENVSLIDEKGNLLTSGESDSEAVFELEATRLQYQREVENGFVRRIEQMLERVLGPGKVVARVTADLDFSMNEREEEIFDPGGQVVRSETTIEEGITQDERGGIPGVVSNLNDEPNLLAAPGERSNQRREEVKNYEVSRAVTRTSAPRGKLTKLSVAVLVDGTPVPDAGSTTPIEFAPLQPDTLDQIEDIVKSAVGYDASRGDTVTVENVPFHMGDGSLLAALESQMTMNYLTTVLRYLGPSLLVVLFFLFIVRPFVRFLTSPTEAEVDLERLLPTGLKELEAELDAERKKAASVPDYEPTVDLEQLEELMSENSRIVRENPQQAALLIRYWLNDGRL